MPTSSPPPNSSVISDKGVRTSVTLSYLVDSVLLIHYILLPDLCNTPDADAFGIRPDYNKSWQSLYGQVTRCYFTVVGLNALLRSNPEQIFQAFLHGP